MRVSLKFLNLISGLLFLTLKSSDASAAVVTKVSPKKKLVMIDEGTNTGFTKGVKVCFFAEDKKIACGKVSKSKKTTAMVKVSKRIKLVKQGQTASLDTGLGASSSSSTGTSSTALRFLYLPYFLPLTPATYNIVTYQGALSEQDASLWNIVSPYDTMTLFSFGLEFEFSSLRLGAHYKAYTGYPVETDYDPQNSNLYTSSLLDATAMGGYVDYVLWRAGDFTLATGLDADMTTVSLITTRKDDNATEEEIELYKVSASSTILSLRLPLRYEPNFAGMGLTFGVNLMLPLTSLGDSASATVNDPTNATKNADPEADVLTAIGLTSASLALEAVLGLAINF